MNLTVLMTIVFVGAIAMLYYSIAEWVAAKSKQPTQLKRGDFDGYWMQKRSPVFKGIYSDKNNKQKILLKYHPSMYIYFHLPLSYVAVGVKMIPNRSLYYDGEHIISNKRSYSAPVERQKQNLLEGYEIVSQPKLVNKLECVVREYEKTSACSKQKEKDDILKIALSHRCK